MKLYRFKINIEYALVHGIYWIVFSLVMTFASAYLISLGYNAAEIGMILGLGSVIALILQPLIASLADKYKAVTTLRIIILVYIIMLAASLMNNVLGEKSLAFTIFWIVKAAMARTVLSFINALQFEMSDEDAPITFSTCRSLGSFMCAIGAIITGKVIAAYGEITVLYGGHIFSLVMLGLLFIIAIGLWRHRKNRPAEQDEGTQNKEAKSLIQFARDNKRFMILVISIAIVYFSHVLGTNFGLIITTHVGGTAEDFGLMSAVMVLTELPVLLVYKLLRKRFRCSTLFMFSLVMYLVKIAAIWLAPTVPLLIAANALQGVYFGLYMPTSVEYAAKVVSKADTVKAQTSFGLSVTLGAILASVIGGALINIDINMALLTGTIVAAAGLLISVFVMQKTD